MSCLTSFTFISPTSVMEKIPPVIIAGPETTVKETGKPALAVANKVNGISSASLLEIGAKINVRSPVFRTEDKKKNCNYAVCK